MTFSFKDVLGYELQVIGVWICIALHGTPTPSVVLPFILYSQVNTYQCFVFTDFQRTNSKFCCFHNFSLRFILRIYQNFAYFSLDILNLI